MPFNIICQFCEKEVTKRKKTIFCSKECKLKSSLIIKDCSSCCKEVRRRLSQFKKSKTENIFCNSSCAATFNNSVSIKRKKKQKIKLEKQANSRTRIKPMFLCKICSVNIWKPNALCRPCYNKHRTKKGFVDLSLKDAIYTHLHKASAFALVRTRARTVLKTMNINSCQSCGYSKHIEACHIKPIKSFSEDTKLSVINDPKNLLGLCRNCHWELDHNLLDKC